jgi:hypothetical protein
VNYYGYKVELLLPDKESENSSAGNNNEFPDGIKNL